jgi:chromosome segregation ATPase
MADKESELTQNAPPLVDEIGEASRLLNELSAEQARLPGEIREAQERGDVPGMVRLRHRAGEIGLHINATQIKLLRLEIASLEQEHEKAKAAAEREREKLPAAEERFAEARAAFARANGAYLTASEYARSLPARIGQAKLRLDVLRREQSAA